MGIDEWQREAGEWRRGLPDFGFEIAPRAQRAQMKTEAKMKRSLDEGKTILLLKKGGCHVLMRKGEKK